jgi:hypothetical protein
MIRYEKKEIKMAYAVISNWKSNDGNTAEMKALAGSKYALSIKALGAVGCYFIETSGDKFSVCTIYPDEKTAMAAREQQNSVRTEASSEMPIKLLGDVRGDIFASF